MRYLSEDQGEPTIYHTVRCGNLRHHGRMWGRVVPYGTNCAGNYIMRRLLATSTCTVSVSYYHVCKVATRSCQILANLLSFQLLYMVCNNRYGDPSPCLVVNSNFTEVICVLVVRGNPACFHCRRGAYFVMPRFSFFLPVFN
jgi:hypothetical protein